MVCLKVVECQIPYAGGVRTVFGLFDTDIKQPHLAATAFLLRKTLDGSRLATVRTYANCLAPFLVSVGKNVKVAHWDGVTDEFIYAYFEQALVAEKALSGNTLKLIRTVLMEFYKWALEQGWTSKKRFISKSTVQAIRDKLSIETSREHSLDKYRLFAQYIPENSFLALQEWIPTVHEFELQRDLICLKLGYYSGWRRSEVVDPSNIQVKRIKQAIKVAEKKHHAGFYLVIVGKGRGGGKARQTYIPPKLRGEIERFLDGPHRRIGSPKLLICMRTGAALGAHHCSYLFDKTRKGLIIGEQNFDMVEEWIDLKERCFHSLRHSFATNLARYLLENNQPLTILQELMGHADIEVTLTYVHFVAYLSELDGPIFQSEPYMESYKELK